MDRNWSELPNELLGVIALKSSNINDFVSFPSICRSWCYAWLDIKKHWHPSMPFLILSENPTQNLDCSRQVFDPNAGVTYSLSLPQMSGRKCFGSSCGWVVTLGLDLDVQLFNPLSKKRVDLPRLAVDSDLDPYWLRSRLIHRALVVPADNDDESEIVVVLVRFCPVQFAVVSFARPGDSAWTVLEFPDVPENPIFPLLPENIVVWKGLLHIITSYHCVLCWDFNTEVPKACVAPLYNPERLVASPDLKFDRLYLVDCFGDLLLVQRIKKNFGDPYPRAGGYRTLAFKVYKLNIGAKWEELKDLGDVALFLGDSTSMAVRATQVPKCSPNRIYFTDDENHYWDPSTGETGGFDMGVFTIGDGEPDPFYQGDDTRSAYCTPFWFLPRLT